MDAFEAWLSARGLKSKGMGTHKEITSKFPLSAAMEFRASAEDMSRYSHPHPTFTEALKEAMGVLGEWIDGWADRGLYYKLGSTGITLKLKRKQVNNFSLHVMKVNIIKKN
jgi:hypothetical protein